MMPCTQQVSLLLSRVNSFTLHEGEGLSSGCTQDSTGCISSSQAYRIHKVLHLTGGHGIPLTFCATFMALIQVRTNTQWRISHTALNGK